ncbi:MAG: TetR family transcriptional regulator [Rhizobiales bacterium]|nr:TetR family transcriptional regulator [Hyphomicrobiales bacterium]
MPFESRRRARDEKREAVLRTAVALFLEQGYHGTTLNHVAERLNITKPALYNYFRGKDEILYECWAIGAERVDESIDEIDATGGTGIEKLRKLIVSYAEAMTTDYGKSLVRFDIRDLTEHNRRIVRLAKKKIDQAFRDYIGQGIEDGSIRACNVKLSAFAIAGSLNWIGHWHQPNGALEAEAIAREFAIRLTEGLAIPSARKSMPKSTTKKAGKPPVRKRKSTGGSR